MPADTATSSSTQRLSGSREHSQTTHPVNSLTERQPSHKQTSAQGKPQKHVVGHGKLGTRNPSYGRILNKLLITAPKGDDDAVRAAANGSPLSPRFKISTKRGQNLVSLMPRNTSGTALKKNHSSGHLHRNTSGNTSARHLSRSHRPEYHRSKSHDSDKKSKRLKSPPPPKTNGKHAAVHFDIGSDDDDVEDMEGVDDGWTEESASQSPNTTRENTRSNTRSNSVILDPEQNPHKQEKEKPPDMQRRNVSSERDPDQNKDTSSDNDVTPTVAQDRSSSQHDPGHLQKPPDAEAIAKRLLQRNEVKASPAQVSSISASASPKTPSSPTPEAQTVAQRVSPSTSSLPPMVSRFIDPSLSTPESKEATPSTPAGPDSSRPQTANTTASGTQSTSTTQKSPQRSRVHYDSDNIRRSQSTRSFILPPSSPDAGTSGGNASGPPSGPLRQSRTQQKLWLQRGLSNIEANSQSNLPGLLMNGANLRRGGPSSAALSALGGPGGMVGVAERIEKELVAVRRYRNPVEESISRLRKVKGGVVAGMVKGNSVLVEERPGQGKSPKKGAGLRGKKEGAKTPRGAASRSRAVSPGPETASEERQGREWIGLGLRELEGATLDVRRQMWELQSTEVTD